MKVWANVAISLRCTLALGVAVFLVTVPYAQAEIALPEVALQLEVASDAGAAAYEPTSRTSTTTSTT